MTPVPRSLLDNALGQHRAGHLVEAERQYRAILDLDPGHADALHLLGAIAQQQGHPAEAADLIGRAIAGNDRVPAFHNNLANCLVVLGRLDEAVGAYRRAIALAPDHFEAHLNLARTLQTASKFAEAEAMYARCRRLRPGSTQALGGLAQALQQQGRIADALASIEQTIALDPANAGHIVNRGNILKAQGRLSEASEAYRRAIVLQPRLAEAHNNLGLTLLQQDDLPAAVECYRRATALQPDYAESYVNLGDALRLLGRAEAAVGAYESALAIDRDRPDARLGLAMATLPVVPSTPELADAALPAFVAALGELALWAAKDPARLRAVAGRAQPFHLAYRPVDATHALCQYGDLIGSAMPALAPDPGRGSRRLRILIVSAHVRDHPVWRIILRGWLMHLDSTRFEVLLYHVGTKADGETRWAAGRVDRFVEGGRSMVAWQERIAEAGPDIILYPEVGMDPVTAALASRRLAPLQGASWGHPITTGLPSIDFFLSGEALESADADDHYRERLVRLPGTGASFDWEEAGAEPWGLPPAPGTVRFALCQQPIKFDPADDALIARIARASGACEFWLVVPKRDEWSGELLHARLSRAFVAEGLDPAAYLRITPWMTPAKFNGFLDAMDIYLDCPAFSGFTTALQAVQRGLPIVTLEGAFLRQRLAAGLLREIGEDDGIAASGDEYAARAAAWAVAVRDRPNWKLRREGLRRAAGALKGDRRAVDALQGVLVSLVDEGRR